MNVMADTVHQKAGYLRDAVFAANDGIITTFAVVAGSAGASLGATVVLILGFANLFADGFSMAAGTYLGVKSEVEYEKGKGTGNLDEGPPIKHGMVTFFAFNLAGLVPLLPFLFKVESNFQISTILVGLSLFGVGLAKSVYAKRNIVKSSIESFLVGGFAAFVAYIIGFIVKRFVV
ncbi:hypothetical protein A2125_02095 [Candidatus Woesebacteria bacterium GWB1_43_5]|uniref:VIT family protein n=1 Tax=Candidatus Woesebacteria bacterium GWB1_43_5 TaxID=1802474 RepID=A0A1F7WS03_9BACT|nr:MAG: hypothetical protein A2125_02095 [Candidatus Woesebacteria bacterium GWB1_43_5]